MLDKMRRLGTQSEIFPSLIPVSLRSENLPCTTTEDRVIKVKRLYIGTVYRCLYLVIVSAQLCEVPIEYI